MYTISCLESKFKSVFHQKLMTHWRRWMTTQDSWPGVGKTLMWSGLNPSKMQVDWARLWQLLFLSIVLTLKDLMEIGFWEDWWLLLVVIPEFRNLKQYRLIIVTSLQGLECGARHAQTSISMNAYFRWMGWWGCPLSASMLFYHFDAIQWQCLSIIFYHIWCYTMSTN